MRFAHVLVLLAACADETSQASPTFEFRVRVGALPDGVSDALVDGALQPIDETTYPTRTVTIDRAFDDYSAARAAPPLTLEFRDASGATIDLGMSAPGACATQCGASCELALESIFVSFERLHEHVSCYSCETTSGTGFAACY